MCRDFNNICFSIAIVLGAAVSILLFGCASHSSEEIAEALRRIRAVTSTNSETAEAADPVQMPLREQLQFEVRTQTELLNRAAESADTETLARAGAALEKAKLALAAEEKRLEQLADLRARTPNRIIPPRTTTRAAASRPAEVIHSEAINSAVASLPASGPAALQLQELQLKEIIDKINSLADLRASAGDPGGAARLQQRASAWRIEYQKGNRVRALSELQKALDYADR